MRTERLKNFMFMLLVAISIVVISACSSGGGGNSSVRVLTLAYDTDKDGVPDIFDDYPDDAAGYAYTAYSENVDSTGYFTAPSTFRGTIDSATSVNEFAVRVEGGTTYSLVFYNPQKLDTRAVTFVPDVAVYTGSEEKLPLELSVVGDSHVI